MVVNPQFLKNCLFACCGKVFLKSIRAFGEETAMEHVSLRLKSISLESLHFVLNSIRMDRMQPNEILIHSRIKEYFGLKICMKEWKKFFEEIYENNQFLENINSFEGILERLCVDMSPEGKIIIYPEGKKWSFDDLMEVEKEDV